VKNQFFADKHDYFKYDFWLYIAEGVKVKSLTFIPMLTPNDLTKEGLRISYLETTTPKLMGCMSGQLE
jgi:hypothetical protein